MAFTVGKDVAVGDPTEEADHDNLSADQDWLQANADVDHDFDVTAASGAVGWHRADADNPMQIRNEDGTPVVLSLAVHQDANADKWLLVRFGDQSSVTNANADGYIVMAEVPAGGIPA